MFINNYFIFNCSDSTIGGFTYCSDNGLNFSASAAAYSEDDGDFTPGRRGKASRVSVTVYFSALHIPNYTYMQLI